MPDSAHTSEDELRTALLLEAMEKRPTGSCVRCQAEMSSHEVVIAHAMGFKDRFTCPDCIAKALGKPTPEFLEHVLRHIEHRPCFLQAWKWASKFHGLGETLRPPRLFPGQPSLPTNNESVTPEGMADIRDPVPGSGPEPTSANDPSAGHKWDAGDMGCGDLVLELRIKLQAMAAGQLLEVRATDPGAPEDIPAWCGMTSHVLVIANHPTYVIRRRERP
jgi:tRNA 2-thiouridine synthesizing protein A